MKPHYVHAILVDGRRTCSPPIRNEVVLDRMVQYAKDCLKDDLKYVYVDTIKD